MTSCGTCTQSASRACGTARHGLLVWSRQLSRAASCASIGVDPGSRRARCSFGAAWRAAGRVRPCTSTDSQPSQNYSVSMCAHIARLRPTGGKALVELAIDVRPRLLHPCLAAAALQIPRANPEFFEPQPRRSSSDAPSVCKAQPRCLRQPRAPRSRMAASSSARSSTLAKPILRANCARPNRGFSRRSEYAPLYTNLLSEKSC